MFLFYDWPFPHVYFAENVGLAYFHFNSWLSFQRLCRLIWGYHFHFVDSNHASNSSVILSLPGTCASSGLQDVGNRHDVGL